MESGQANPTICLAPNRELAPIGGIGAQGVRNKGLANTVLGI